MQSLNPFHFIQIYQLTSKFPSCPIHHFKLSITLNWNLAQLSLYTRDKPPTSDQSHCSLSTLPLSAYSGLLRQSENHEAWCHYKCLWSILLRTPTQNKHTLTNLSTVASHIFFRNELWWTLLVDFHAPLFFPKAFRFFFEEVPLPHSHFCLQEGFQLISILILLATVIRSSQIDTPPNMGQWDNCRGF